ncbi:general amidase [Ceratobasidium sp. AG-I]|nr:general amidase [Ceratobasidium sp. AG-I]
MQNWKTCVHSRKQQQLDSIPLEWRIIVPKERQNVTRVPYECGLLTPLELEITDTINVEEILVQVTTGFYKRALIAHQTINFLTEMDKYLVDNKKPKGPLHGLPINLKDQFTTKGLETINGYVANIRDFGTQNCILVGILHELGAVPLIRTNVPQTLMWGETYNNVFGRTSSSYNLSLTSGGSFGGEGTLIAMRGSPLGIRTDIGGNISVRIPSAICGIYGLRPSYCRLPYYGVRNTLDGQETIMSVLGPMANSISGLKIFTKAVIDACPWTRDPLCIRKVWDEEAYELVEQGGRGGKKCFATLYDNGLVRPNPPMFRAMNMVRKALEAAGQEIIGWENLKHEELLNVMIQEQAYLADGDQDFRHECERSGEPRILTIDPSPYFHYFDKLSSNGEKNELLVRSFFAGLVAMSLWELRQMHKKKPELRKKYLDHWNSAVSQTKTGRPVNAIISLAFVILPLGKNMLTFYTSIWSALDYTVGVIPVTAVNLDLDQPVLSQDFYNENDRK